jgi:TubC N-terminal docking domain
MPRDPAELLAELRSAGFTITLRGSRIAVAPREWLTPAIITEIRRHREELIALLSSPRPPVPEKPPPQKREAPVGYRGSFWDDPTARDVAEDAGIAGENPLRGF